MRPADSPRPAQEASESTCCKESDNSGSSWDVDCHADSNTNVHGRRGENFVLSGLSFRWTFQGENCARPESFPFQQCKLPQTYCVNRQVPDSGCSATAFLSGIKTNFGVLSMSGNVEKRNCTTGNDKANQVESIFKYAQDAGKATGFVTTSRVTHATVAGKVGLSRTEAHEIMTKSLKRPTPSLHRVSGNLMSERHRHVATLLIS